MAAESRYSEDISFVGYSDNPFKYCKNSAVYAMSSTSEGFPNALVEAMAVKVPVVSTNCKTGPAEILFKNKNSEIAKEGYTVGDYGIITPVFNQNKPDFENGGKDITHRIFADALEKLITDKNLSHSLSEAALEKAWELDQYSMIKQYENLFETI